MAKKKDNQEFVQFKAHPSLYKDVIRRQAGTLSKAIMEGLQNGVDAGAKKIAVTLDVDRVGVTDDGGGFPDDRALIESWFATFGTPHETDEDDHSTDATFGRFRIGRGQMFCFGVNQWRTGKWQMDVDINADDDGFPLTELKDRHPGCSIDIRLYEILNPHKMRHTEKELREMARFMPAEVTLNGELISEDVSTVPWDEVTEDAYIKFLATGQGIKLYNQGAWVETYGAYRWGMSGLVVTKGPVKLNTARNQVITSCKRFKRITRVLDRLSGEKVAKKTRLTEDERISAIDRLKSGDLDRSEMRKQHLFKDTGGKGWSINMLIRATAKSAGWELTPTEALRISFAKRGSREGEQAANMKRGVVFNKDVLDEWDVKRPENFIQRVFMDVFNVRRSKLAYVKDPAELLDDPEDREYHYLEEKHLKPTEVAVLRTLNSASWKITGIVRRALGVETTVESFLATARRYRIGLSNKARAWTDGSSFVAIHREEIKPSRGMSFWIGMAQVVIYQQLWGEENLTRADSEQDPQLDAKFRRVCDYGLSAVAMDLMSNYVRRLERDQSKGVKLPQRMEAQLMKMMYSKEYGMMLDECVMPTEEFEMPGSVDMTAFQQGDN